MRLPRRRYLVVAVVAIVALAVCALLPLLTGAGSLSAKDTIEADPAPRLFADRALAPVDPLVVPQAARAHEAMADWWRGHGRKADDTGFQKWLLTAFPAPPKDRAKELPGEERLAHERTAAGVKAATWLEAHGKKDVWKLYAHDQREWLTASAGHQRKADEKLLLKLSKKAADTLGTRFGVSAPYVLEPSLRPDHQVKAGQTCPCSYPSRHASAAAASRTYLAHFAPHMDAEYRWMEDEIDWSRIYMAGHVPSDIEGGALLGDMLAEYVLVTRDHVDPATLG
ncbi:hypothetical protein GCM10011584_19590 [Nocardioides phosphati]|uniref:Phosphatidic acid phosphatase type 2/haloperoxidase domain-containing protein n=1 Tax=Nocardioides phosphati TaxID=1867775 RepID=A0ABQ2NAQ1_9ACTN|nr:phosphatase PAP2 family protein [Nocardioides phosphati]GGO89642.1 hypothetical protein GCM10011584_19590 [Nocardioides phosphati]